MKAKRSPVLAGCVPAAGGFFLGPSVRPGGGPLLTASSLGLVLRSLVLVLVCFLWTGCEGDRSGHLLKKANDEWVKGNHSQAVELFKEILEKFPREQSAEEAMFRLGELHQYSLGDSDQAVMHYQDLLKSHPGSAFAYDAQKNIADILEFSSKNLDQAIIEYQKLIFNFNRAEENSDHQYRIASIYLKKQEYDQALVEFGTLIDEYPESPWQEDSRFKVAELLYTLARCQEVHALHGDFVKKYPKSRFLPELDFVVASCLEDEGRLKEAYEKLKTLEGRYSYPAMLEMKMAGLEKRIAKRGKKKK